MLLKDCSTVTSANAFLLTATRSTQPWSDPAWMSSDTFPACIGSSRFHPQTCPHTQNYRYGWFWNQRRTRVCEMQALNMNGLVLMKCCRGIPSTKSLLILFGAEKGWSEEGHELLRRKSYLGCDLRPIAREDSDFLLVWKLIPSSTLKSAPLGLKVSTNHKVGWNLKVSMRRNCILIQYLL